MLKMTTLPRVHRGRIHLVERGGDRRAAEHRRGAERRGKIRQAASRVAHRAGQGVDAEPCISTDSSPSVRLRRLELKVTLTPLNVSVFPAASRVTMLL